MGEPAKTSGENSDVPSSPASKERLGVEEIMREIRERVSRLSKSSEGAAVRKREADFSQSGEVSAGELAESEHLRYLNQHYAPSVSLRLEEVKSHRKGPIAKALVSFKRKVLVTVWDYLFKPFIEDERDFRANEVRLLNRLVRYVDERDGALFWELIRKLDYDIAEIDKKIGRLSEQLTGDFRSAEQSLRAEQESNTDGLRKSFNEQSGSISDLRQQIRELDSVTRGVEGILSRYGVSENSTSADAPSPTPPAMPNLDYLLLENRYRGSEQDISEHLKRYVKLFEEETSELSGDVLEMGCGRGELLSLFSNAGIASRGIDIDQAMVDACKERQLNAVLGDGLESLKETPDASLRGFIAIQVIEHLPASYIESLLKLIRQKLQPGGIVVFETINPLSLRALSSNYFRDPTHVAPIHPDTAKYLLTLRGFEDPSVEFISAFPEQERFQSLSLESFMTPRWREFVEGYNRNVQKLNELVYSPQDFYVIAKVPTN